MIYLFYKYLTGTYLICVIFSCSPVKRIPEQEPVKVQQPLPAMTKDPVNKEDAFLSDLFAQYPGLIDNALKNRKEWNVQVIYTQVNRDAGGKPELTTHQFNTGGSKYFYPASAVKLPVVLLALQRINELNIPGLNKQTTMVTHAGYKRQTPVYHDPNTPIGLPSVAQYIKRILLVSDNDAYNRLFELLGSGYINKELHKRGFTNAQILHHLELFLTEDENRHSNPVSFYSASNDLVYEKPMEVDKAVYERRTDKIGKGYYSNGVLKSGPMDFSGKNRLSLTDLHQIMAGLIFPDAVPKSRQFNITAADRQFVMQYMSQYPKESIYPGYDSNYHDAYGKFLLLGGQKGTPPPSLRIFNKSGDAYGQMIDAAYVVDYEKNIEFILSAAIYSNSNEVLNDDHYDYETIGLPFMQNLGKIFYDYEAKRIKKYKPDLSSIIFKYDK